MRVSPLESPLHGGWRLRKRAKCKPWRGCNHIIYRSKSMHIINIRFIKDVVATPEQKLELISKMTDTFVGVLGEVVSPFVYCIIDEVTQMDWGIAGVPMPDLKFLTSEAGYGKVYQVSKEAMLGAIAQMEAQNMLPLTGACRNRRGPRAKINTPNRLGS